MFGFSIYWGLSTELVGGIWKIRYSGIFIACVTVGKEWWCILTGDGKITRK